jgi:hypothetical protein
MCTILDYTKFMNLKLFEVQPFQHHMAPGKILLPIPRKQLSTYYNSSTNECLYLPDRLCDQLPVACFPSPRTNKRSLFRVSMYANMVAQYMRTAFPLIYLYRMVPNPTITIITHSIYLSSSTLNPYTQSSNLGLSIRANPNQFIAVPKADYNRL